MLYAIVSPSSPYVSLIMYFEETTIRDSAYLFELHDFMIINYTTSGSEPVAARSIATGKQSVCGDVSKVASARICPAWWTVS